jgi:class 3 adenylate cyclase/predicted ATPase
MLQRERRVTYRTLKYVFGVDDAFLEQVQSELRFKQLAMDENGEGLVWTGEGHMTVHPPVATPSRAVMAETAAVSAPSLPTSSSIVTRTDTQPNDATVRSEDAPPDRPLDELVAGPEPTRHVLEAERRQLTVMLCDLVGSTDLSRKLDPEDLREVVRAYQETAAEVIERYEGHIAQYLGDGLLIYFGFPVAHENDAARAVYTGLGIPEAMATLNHRLEADYGVQLAVRIGIHTGPVVIGEMGGGNRHENLALGETPNIAARLEGLAHPNSAVISSATAQLVQRGFILEELGPHELKGMPEPMILFRVVGPRTPDQADDSAITGGFDALLGRDEEIGLLQRRWEQSKEGRGQVILVSGEAGIGKSSLVGGLRDHVRQEGFTRIAFRCSPYHTNSALHPIIEHVQRALGWAAEDTADSQLAKLEQGLRGTSLPLEEAIPLLASLLSLPLPEGRYPALSLSSQQQRQQTQDVLVAWLLEEAERQAVLAVWEDLHWADPSTLETLELFVDQAPTSTMLHVLTFRPEFEPPWPMRSHLTPITLNRLERPQVEGLVTRLAGGKALPAEVLEHIVVKTDGVPLYVEELTKMLLESDLLGREAEQYVLTGPLLAVAIPDTLHDSLMARLDQMNAAKEVAQLGAVLGREFTYEMLQAITSQDDETVQAGLEQLVAAELLYQRGRPPRAKYIFKHALIQDAAYVSLLRSTRQRVHQQVAQVLEACFVDGVEIQPELVAHHYTEGGCAEEAVVYWQRAGQQAIARSANREAISHLEQGLEVLAKLPQTHEQLERELDLQMALGSALVATRGYTDARVGQVYGRCRKLCQALGNQLHDFSVLRGQQVYHVARGELAEAKPLAEVVLRIAEREGDATRLVGGHYTLGSTLLFAGELTAALTHAEQGIALYDPANDQLLTWPGSHPAVQCQFYRALILWSCGYPEQALDQNHEALQQAQRLAHSFTLAQTTCKVALLHVFRREPSEAAKRAAASIELCREHGVSFWLPFARVVYGWALFWQGQAEQGLGEMQEGVKAYYTPSRRLFVPLLLALQADAHLKLGQSSKAYTAISEALAVMNQNGEGWWESELYRLKGEQLCQSVAKRQASSIHQDVEACFHQALAVARQQQAKSLELRAAVALARLWQSQGKCQDAYELLEPVYGWFTEGFDTADLQEAKTLLEQLRA